MLEPRYTHDEIAAQLIEEGLVSNNLGDERLIVLIENNIKSVEAQIKMVKDGLVNDNTLLQIGFIVSPTTIELLLKYIESLKSILCQTKSPSPSASQ